MFCWEAQWPLQLMATGKRVSLKFLEKYRLRQHFSDFFLWSHYLVLIIVLKKEK